LFFGIALTLTGLAHYYVWGRLVRDAQLPSGPHRALTVLFVGLYLSIPASFVLRQVGPERTLPLFWLAMIWLGLLFLLFVVLGAADLLRLTAASLLSSRGEPFDAERRRLLSRIFAGAVASIAVGLGLVAVRSGLGRVALREIAVRLPRLPRALDGTTIVQLTDVHVGPTIGRDFIEEIVAQANAAEPDVIAITGDLVDGSVDELREHVSPLGKLRARYGVYFVTGNHEYYSGAEEWCAELERLGIRVLRNERVSIGEGDASFDLAGVDDYHAHQFGNGHGADLKRALAGRDAERELVLLAHQPKAVLEAAEAGVGLQLSGHTHGGQIWPWRYLVRLQQPVVSGLARFGETWVYVSNGTGYWGPPMRLGAPAEVTKIVLRA
jgi:predicted MPP superfamily phosphohydrolase